MAQITTCKGIVMGRLRSAQRQLEVELMRFCHNKLGEKPVSSPLTAVGFICFCIACQHVVCIPGTG